MRHLHQQPQPHMLHGHSVPLVPNPNLPAWGVRRELEALPMQQGAGWFEDTPQLGLGGMDVAVSWAGISEQQSSLLILYPRAQCTMFSAWLSQLLFQGWLDWITIPQGTKQCARITKVLWLNLGTGSRGLFPTLALSRSTKWRRCDDCCKNDFQDELKVSHHSTGNEGLTIYLFFNHHLTAFIAAVLGHILEFSSQINENQAEDWALCPSMQQCRSDSLLGCSSWCHAQLWPLPALQPFVVSWAVPPWFFQLFSYSWLPILPPHGCGTCQPLPTAQLSPLTLLVQHPQPCPGPRCPGETNPIILVRPD